MRKIFYCSDEKVEIKKKTKKYYAFIQRMYKLTGYDSVIQYIGIYDPSKIQLGGIQNQIRRVRPSNPNWQLKIRFTHHHLLFSFKSIKRITVEVNAY